MATATFGAGCFWGVEEKFRKTRGVKGTVVGYAGGHTENPSYEEVCTDRTGHAEVVQLDFDPIIVSYTQLLSVFFSMHDPTQVNRQGVDVGSQYRSLILVHDSGQHKEAESMIKALNASGRYLSPIATEVAPYTTFFRAEEYHQQYIAKRSRAI